MTRADRVVGMARTAASRVLEAVGQEAMNSEASASFVGALGGSRHTLQLSEICIAGMRRLASAVQNEMATYDEENLLSYREPFARILEAAIPRLLDVFRGHGGFAPSFGRASVKEEAELRLVLKTAVAEAIERFELTATIRPVGDVDRDLDLKLALLRCFSKTERAHRINVLGRPYQTGAVEGELGVKLTDAQRARAGTLLRELERDGLVAATYSDIAEPENWLAITDAGREALTRGQLDELDSALARLSPTLPSVRHGAWAASLSGQPDSMRQAAHSARELISLVLDGLAPLDQLRAEPGYKPSPDSSSGVTRKMRFRHAIKKRASGMSESDIEVLEAAAEFLDKLYLKLSGVAHARAPATRDLKSFLQSTETILALLLL